MTPETNDPRPTWTDPTAVEPATTSQHPPTPAEVATPVLPPPPAPVPVVVTARRSGGWVNLLLGAAAVIAVGGVAFAVGRSTAPAATIGGLGLPDGGAIVRPGGSFDPNGSFDPGSLPGGGQGGLGLIGSGGLTIDGTVTAVDGDTLTIALDSGETMDVTVDGDTTYHAATEATESDVVVGDEVAVRLSGGRVPVGGDASSAPGVTADDVTVAR